MLSMIRERADWCISRQRRWGVPIPVFYCDDCGKPVCTDGDHRTGLPISSASRARTPGIDAEAKELLPDGFTCPHCGGSTGFTKETDTLDGWFDSGCTPHRRSMQLDVPSCMAGGSCISRAATSTAAGSSRRC